jgi:hypothetical protein
VGVYLDAAGINHGFLLSGGVYTTIDDPLGVTAQGGTQPSQINDSGQIVGAYFDATGLVHGYVQVGNRYTTVDDPAAAQGDFVNGNNDLGQLVGGYNGATGLEHAFLATPGPDYAASATAPAAPALPTALTPDPAPPASGWLSTGQPAVLTSPVSGLAPPPALRPSPAVVLPTARTTASVRVRAADAVFAAPPAAPPDDPTRLFAPLDASSPGAV